MPEQFPYNDIIISVSGKEFRVKTTAFDVEVPISYDKETTRLQSSVARALQRVLRTYKFGASAEKIFVDEDYLLLGQLLCQILLGKTLMGIIKMGLKNTIDSKTKTLKQRCRIYLEFAPDIDEDLALLPWEYTWAEFELDGMEPSFLAADLQGQFDLIRRTNSKPLELPPVTNNESSSFTRLPDHTISFSPDSPKRILIVLVLVQFDKLPTGQYNQLINYFKSRNFIVREIANPGFSNIGSQLDEILLEEKASMSSFILHYYGHAHVEQDKGLISLKAEGKNEPAWIPDHQFADIFQNAGRRPQIMLLQACSSGQIVQYSASEKRGIALLLSLKGIPAVVAMQNDVSVLDSFAFVQVFYSALLQGDDVAEAVTRGRQHLGSKYLEENSQTKYSTNAFGAPILFISTKSPVQLVARLETSPEQSTNSGDSRTYSPMEKIDLARPQNEPRRRSFDADEAKAVTGAAPADAVPEKAEGVIANESPNFNV